MPLPMMVPTTTADAWLTPKSRESSARGGTDCVPLAILELEYTRETREFALCGFSLRPLRDLR